MLKNDILIQQAGKEIEIVFQLNKGMADDFVVWDYFKAYIRGIFMSYAAYKQKSDHSNRDLLVKQLETIEKRQKQEPLLEWQERLDKFKGDIALIDAHLVAKDNMFSKQKLFKFRDKPGKNLARILADKP